MDIQNNMDNKCIVILELVHFDYSHESFNAGTVWQYAKANPNYIILYCAEKKSVERVKKIVGEEQNVKYVPLDVLDGIRDKQVKPSEKMYADILSEIFLDRHIIRMIATGIEYRLYHSIGNFIRKHSDTEFYFFQHGEIECLLDDGRIKKWGRYRVNNLRYRLGIDRSVIRDYLYQIHGLFSGETKKNKEQYIEHLEALSKEKNVWFYVFSDEYKKYKLPVSDEVLSRFIRIHLPYVFDQGKTHEKKCDSVTKFLICASTAESRDGLVWKIVNFVNDNIDRISGEFEFILGGGDCRNMNNTVAFTDQERGQRDLHAAMEYCDWLLLPYPEERYRLSASGVLTDAIDMRIPVVMGPSGCFEEASEYEIGVRGYKATEIGNLIIDIINKDIHVDDSKFDKFRNCMYDSNVEQFCVE